MKKVIKIVAIALMIVSVGVFATAMANPAPTNTAYAAVYQQGSRGTTVKTIQQKLKNWGYYKGSVDGIFGAKTKEAVKYFQRKNNLTVDGIVGAQTLKALGISSGSSSSTKPGGSKPDVSSMYYTFLDIYENTVCYISKKQGCLSTMRVTCFADKTYSIE